jgi:hypothetical protein
MNNRWWIYQKERFPIAAHGPLVAVFSYSALSYSALLSHFPHAPGIAPALVAFLTALCIELPTSSKTLKMTADTGHTGQSRAD